MAVQFLVDEQVETIVRSTETRQNRHANLGTATERQDENNPRHVATSGASDVQQERRLEPPPEGYRRSTVLPFDLTATVVTLSGSPEIYANLRDESVSF